MIPVKTMPRFKCDFCNHRSVKWAMEKHEGRCYNNPDRFCDNCENKGYTVECHGDLIEDGDCGLSEEVSCHYCKKVEEIKKRIAKEKEIKKYI